MFETVAIFDIWMIMDLTSSSLENVTLSRATTESVIVNIDMFEIIYFLKNN